MSNTAIGVVGSDGYTPLYQPDGRWAMWSMDEIYLGHEGQGKFIPKVLDYVVEPASGNMFRVQSLSVVTFVPELVPVELRKEVTVDEIISAGSYHHRLYFDKSVQPYTLSVDGLLRVHGSAASFARIYKGAFIDPTKIISRRYNGSGVFIGHDVPLELVAYQQQENYAIKSIPTCNTDQEILDGETCTVVIFDSNGKVLSRTTCLAEETTYVAQAYAEQKYITQISLKSAFIADTVSSEITYPVNLPIAAFNPIGVVHYNDGSSVEYPVDGNKFSLYGLDQFVSTIIGHRVPLVLKYRMDSVEAGLASVETQDQHFLTRAYSLIVSSPNTSYNVKLDVYPVWVDANNGYRLSAYLTNLDRNIMIDVTNHLALASNSPSFNPHGYGLTQRLIFSMDLANVSGVFNHFQHVQTVDVVLRAPANDASAQNLWETSSKVPSPGGYYGKNLRATVDPATRRKASFGNGLQSVQSFIDQVFTPTHAVFNPVTETSAPTPTHIEVSHLDEAHVVPIAEYAQQVQFSHDIGALSNLTLTFLRQSTQGFLKLSVACLTVR